MKFPCGTAMPPLALTDQQIDIIRRASEPLPLRDRGPFLETVATLLDGVKLSDGMVARAAREAQRLYRDLPNLDGEED
jgi:hypothetical protein